MGTTHLNKFVEIINIYNGSRYYGKILGFRWKEDKFCLGNLIIMTKNGEVKAAPKWKNKRWFSAKKFVIDKFM